MKTYRTDLLRVGEPKGSAEQLWVYNGLDCCVTLEVLERLLPELSEITSKTYELSLGLQGPVLEMNMRGVLVDQAARDKAVEDYKRDSERLEVNLYKIIHEGLGFTEFVNSKTSKAWRSNSHVMRLLYDVMGLPEVRKRNERGEMSRTVNREALEKLQLHFLAQPIISHILALRDMGKKIGVLQTKIDADGRMRTSYNIAGTSTGRFSSSLNDFGRGGNMQNIEERLRRIFVPDPGMKFANVDFEQADSRNIGALCWNVFRDPSYLDACESGDLHTTVAKMSRPDLPWTGDGKLDRLRAEEPYYRHHGLRHMCKMLGHGTNYMGSPFEMSRQTKIDRKTIETFQEVYFKAFPSIPKLHEWIQAELIAKGCLITPFGRRRWFMGRRDDKDTLKQAVAHMGQSMTADEMNNAMLQLWRKNIVQILLQGHDSLLMQYPEEKENEIIPQVKEAMQVPLELEGDRKFIVPVEVQVGWNWSKASSDNPLGLAKWPDARRRGSAG